MPFSAMISNPQPFRIFSLATRREFIAVPPAPAGLASETIGKDIAAEPVWAARRMHERTGNLEKFAALEEMRKSRYTLIERIRQDRLAGNL
jgi:hypothetical protein